MSAVPVTIYQVMPDPDTWVRLAKISSLFGVSEETLSQAASDGSLDAIFLARNWLTTVAKYSEWALVQAAGKGWVYFVQMNAPIGPIKIGFSINWQNRIDGLATGSPWPLTVLGVMAGSMIEESALHVRFADFRMAGEWFEPHPDLLAYIQSLRENSA